MNEQRAIWILRCLGGLSLVLGLAVLGLAFYQLISAVLPLPLSGARFIDIITGSLLLFVGVALLVLVADLCRECLSAAHVRAACMVLALAAFLGLTVMIVRFGGGASNLAVNGAFFLVTILCGLIYWPLADGLMAALAMQDQYTPRQRWRGARIFATFVAFFGGLASFSALLEVAAPALGWEPSGVQVAAAFAGGFIIAIAVFRLTTHMLNANEGLPEVYRAYTGPGPRDDHEHH